jgi:hypothetical protein
MIKLTPREAEVAALYNAGLSQPQIARRLGYSQALVYSFILHARRKNGAASVPSRKRPEFDWTDAAILRLCELYGQGLSTAAIGADLRCGKNAVVGKCHRLGLPPRPSPIRRAPPADVAARSDGQPALPA